MLKDESSKDMYVRRIHLIVKTKKLLVFDSSANRYSANISSFILKYFDTYILDSLIFLIQLDICTVCSNGTGNPYSYV